MNDEQIGYEHFTQRRAYKWAVWCLVLIGGLYLITEHRAHLLGALPYALLLACPLMHMFMHRHHGRHGDHGGHDHRGSAKTAAPDEVRSQEEK